MFIALTFANLSAPEERNVRRGFNDPSVDFAPKGAKLFRIVLSAIDMSLRWSEDGFQVALLG
jgi:hypothetical protein